MIKISSATIASGSVMFFLIKFFDQSVWVKRLSFLNQIQASSNIPFEKFVLDTHYTLNVLILTAVAFLIGMLIYVLASLILRIEEASYFVQVLKKFIARRSIPGIPPKEQEPVTPITPDTQGQ